MCFDECLFFFGQGALRAESPFPLHKNKQVYFINQTKNANAQTFFNHSRQGSILLRSSLSVQGKVRGQRPAPPLFSDALSDRPTKRAPAELPSAYFPVAHRGNALLSANAFGGLCPRMRRVKRGRTLKKEEAMPWPCPGRPRPSSGVRFRRDRPESNPFAGATPRQTRTRTAPRWADSAGRYLRRICP